VSDDGPAKAAPSGPTAQKFMDDGRFALRITADTDLRSAPDANAPVVRTLPAGTLLAVRSDAGPFLQVVTPEDELGFIADETAVELPGLRAAASGTPSEPTPGEEAVSARSAVQAAPAGAAPFVAAAVDDDWEPAKVVVTPEERILIYDQIRANKQRTVVIIAAFVLFTVLFFTAIGVFMVAYAGYDPAERVGLIGQIAIASAMVGLAAAIIMYFMATAAVLGVSGAHQVTKEHEPVLYRIVENLSIGSGLPMPKVWVIEDSAPNAFATGRNPQNAHVVATRGLLDKLEKRELEAVMAHEMSHVGNYDIRMMTTVAVLVGLFALVADLMLRFTWYGAGARSGSRDKGGGALAALLLVMAFVLIVLSPIIASLMRAALSRQREYLADSSGALLCRNPGALADALEKISRDTEPLEAANKATAHLYFENPLKEHRSKFNDLFATHPPAEERIAVLRAMG
jgi:heat shock protein HtpX